MTRLISESIDMAGVVVIRLISVIGFLVAYFLLFLLFIWVLTQIFQILNKSLSFIPKLSGKTNKKLKIFTWIILAPIYAFLLVLAIINLVQGAIGFLILIFIAGGIKAVTEILVDPRESDLHS